MKKIIEVSNEILVLYDVLKNNKHMNKYKKHKILKKIEELSYLENHLFSMLVIDKEHYDDYLQEIDSCKNSSISFRLQKYLLYLYSKEKIFLPGLIYSEYADKHTKYYKYFDFEKELNKIIIKNTTNVSTKYEILFSDKLLELDFFKNDFKIRESNIREALNKRELNLFQISKKKYVEDQLYPLINFNIKDYYFIIKSLLEFDKENYEEYYKNIINILNSLEDKTKLDKFIDKFGNGKKLK